MSFGIDVNILLYASDESSALNGKAVAFLERCAQERQVFCMAWITLMSYLRMATHPAIFGKPLAPDEAKCNVEALISLDHCRIIGEEDRFWPIFCEIARDAPARANQVPDAHLAAILRSNGVGVLYTHDRDFRRFPFLDVRDPL